MLGSLAACDEWAVLTYLSECNNITRWMNDRRCKEHVVSLELSIIWTATTLELLQMLSMNDKVGCGWQIPDKILSCSTFVYRYIVLPHGVYVVVFHRGSAGGSTVGESVCGESLSNHPGGSRSMFPTSPRRDKPRRTPFSNSSPEILRML